MVLCALAEWEKPRSVRTPSRNVARALVLNGIWYRKICPCPNGAAKDLFKRLGWSCTGSTCGKEGFDEEGLLGSHLEEGIRDAA